MLVSQCMMNYVAPPGNLRHQMLLENLFQQGLFLRGGAEEQQVQTDPTQVWCYLATTYSHFVCDWDVYL